MKAKTIFAILIVISMLITGLSFAADDGPLHTRNVSKTPEEMTGASQMSTMWLYVPAQTTQGELPDTTSGELEYYAGDCKSSDTSACELIYSRPEAKPLIVTYNDGVGGAEADLGTGAGFGQRDGFAALSLDDGATWKTENLSDSALRSSFTLKDGHAYPGDVFKQVHVVEGNMVAVAWLSRFCESGAPLYSWEDEEKDAFLVAYPELDNPVSVDGVTDPYQLYVDDLFSVAGSQKSVDYTGLGFPEVGEIPYGCVWAARGTLEQALDENDVPLVIEGTSDPVYEIVWRASERLTSGRRDPHQISITSSPGAGIIVSWQEDPDGLRPGKGLGPGEGWSGAIANSKTDIWYTYIDLDLLGDVCIDEPADDTYCMPGTLDDFVTAAIDGKPKVAVPFAMPVRLTDNSQCKGIQRFDTAGELIDPYCYADFDDNGAADMCETTESWTNPGGTTLEVCVTEDGRHMTGRTASTRVRWAMKSYDSDADGLPDSAWVLMGEEKMKALGTLLDEEEEPEDIGKNMWYHTFEFNNPELMAQGLMLNAPAFSPEDGEFIDLLVDEWGYDIYDTEIARRFNLFVNSPAAAMASDSKTMGLLIYKQGILFQGGPADIFIRRLVLPEDFGIIDEVSTGIEVVPLYPPVVEDVPEENLIPSSDTFDAYGFVWYDQDGDGVMDLEFDEEDVDGDGRLDLVEDLNSNGILDDGEDLDDDDFLDLDEDLNDDGILDPEEDLDSDGIVDVFEDLDRDGVLDTNEDFDGDGSLGTVDEDFDSDGLLGTVEEDLDEDGVLDIVEDLDGDNKLDLIEDLNSNGILDDGEDIDGDLELDLDEDLNDDGILDPGEDLDSDGIVDVFEDFDRDGLLGTVAEDQDGDGVLDIFEDLDEDGILDIYEDLDGDHYLDVPGDLDGDGAITYEGVADVTLWLFQDLNGDGIVDVNVDLDGDGDMVHEEDIDGDGVLDLADEDANNNGILDEGEDLDMDGNLDVDEDLNDDGEVDGHFDTVEWGEYSDVVVSDYQGFYLFVDVPTGINYTISVVDGTYQQVGEEPTPVVTSITDNPFAYENVQCVEYADDGTATPVELLYDDGSNPNYVRGLCPNDGMNISGTTIVECDEGSTAADTCATSFPFSLTYEEWASDATTLAKVTEWEQTVENFNDPTWANPYDVSKGHRGFIDGDFIMMMYATAPNWKAGTVGNEAYNLYIRRSFNGGLTWTTLPASFDHIDGITYNGDGTETCEDYGWGGQVEEEACTIYGAGDFEQARNVSRLTGSKVTVLDPRYSPSGGMLKKDYSKLVCDDDLDGVWESCGYTDAVYPEDIRNPATFFATFETGDNTVVDVETGANPLNMYYSRASDFGDDWEAEDVCDSELEDPWYPSASAVCDEGETDLRWDWLENHDEWAVEASVYGNPNGDRFYAVWNQELPIDVENEIFADMDTEFRRIFYNLTDTDAYPSGDILYVSTDRADNFGLDLVLVGTGRDHDNLGEGDGISSYRWWSDIQGHICSEKTMKAPPNGFIPGKHDFSFDVQDNEGNWSMPKTVTIWVAEQFYDTYLPLVTR